MIGDRTLPFDDVAVAREALATRRDELGRRVSDGSPTRRAGWIAWRRRGGRRARAPATCGSREFDGVSIDTRTLARRRAVRRHSRRAVRRRASSPRRRSRGRGGVVVRADGRTRGRGVTRRGRPSRRERVRHRGRRHDGGAAGAGARDPARVGREGRGDHRQRGQDDDEGSDGGVAGGALSRDSQPRELQQPHRAAAVADRAAAAAGDGGRRAGHESRRGDQHAGRASPSRTSACGRTSARRTSASSRRSTRSPMPRRRSSKRATPATLLVANADDARDRGADGRVSPAAW